MELTMANAGNDNANNNMILCCSCGTPIIQNPAAMCMDCLRTSSDIADGIQRASSVQFCRGCDRYFNPPKQWVHAMPESRELLSLLLKRLKGLNKVRLVDAHFVWTEPHSKRLRLKITVQKEAFSNAILQQVVNIEYVVIYTQCPDCAKTYTAHTWKAMVQVRQKVNHKRTFLFLEQMILKHKAHSETINIEEVKDGLNFHFGNKASAVKMVDFLTNVVPVRTKNSEELITRDTKSHNSHYKFTYSVELLPICKDDLICLPKKLAKSFSNISPLVLCSRVGTTVHLTNPQNLQTVEVTPAMYWREPFVTLADVKDLVEFTVLDVDRLPELHGKHALAEVEVARISDLGLNNTTYFVRTHLGLILNAGDTVMGYHLTNTNFNNDEFEALDQSTVPDVILVRKSYPRKTKGKSRTWRIRRLQKVEKEKGLKKHEQDKHEREYEDFLNSIEQDDEVRGNVNLYRASKDVRGQNLSKMEGIEADDGQSVDKDADADVESGDIDSDDLIDNFDDLNMNETDDDV